MVIMILCKILQYLYSSTLFTLILFDFLIGSSVIASFFSEKERIFLKNMFTSNTSLDVWEKLSNSIASNKWVQNDNLKDILMNPLMKICAYYLYNEKRRSNALNSVGTLFCFVWLYRLNCLISQ